MWKAGKYQPSARSSLLTNFNLLSFRYSKVDDIPETPDIVEGRAFALLVIQAISRHLPQLRIDFEASIQPGQRELTCDEFVDFLSHYLYFREYESCPIFSQKARFRAEKLRQQRLAATGSSNTSQLIDLLHSQCDDERRDDKLNARSDVTPGGDEDSGSDDAPPVLAPPVVRTYGRQPVVSEETLRLQRQQSKLALLERKRRSCRPIDGRDEDVALQTLSRMERLNPNVLHDQLVRLYRAIDVEDSDGVCWTELSNFLSDAILQADNSSSAAGGAASFQEDVPFELNPQVCDRPEHPVLGVKGVTLGRNEVSQAVEGVWLVQSRTPNDIPTLTSKGGAPSGGGGDGGGSGAAAEAPGGNFRCSIDVHHTRPPLNTSGNLLPSIHKAFSSVLEENLTQLEWIPLLDLNVSSSGTQPPIRDQRTTSPDRRSPGPHSDDDDASVTSGGTGIPTTGMIAYSSTDLRLRLCEYRLQTGIINCLGAVHVSESFSTMAWSPYWKKLFCCSNAGTMSVWQVNHPLLAARAQALSANSNGTSGYRGSETIPCFERVQTFHEHKSTICKVLFLPLDGSIVTGSLDPRLIVQDLESCTTIADLKGVHAGIRDISYQVDYHMLAACGYEPHVRLWVLHESTRSNSMTLEDRGGSSSTSAQHSLPIIGVHFIPNSPYLASADSHGLMRIWDLRTLRVVQNIDVDLRRLPGHPRDKSIQQLSVIGASDMLLSSRRYTFLIHPLRASTATQRRSEAETFVTMSYSFASSTVISSTPSSMQLWDLRTGSIASVFGTTVSTKEEEITAVAVDTLGRKIIVGFRGGKVRIHSSVNGAVLKTVVASRASGVEIVDIKTLQLGGMCIAVDSNGTVTCFADRDEGCQFATLEVCGFRAQPALFTMSSKVFPFLAIAHSKRLITLFEISGLAGLAPAHHSWLRLGDGDPLALEDDDNPGEAVSAQIPDLPSNSQTFTLPKRRNAVTASAVKVASSIDIIGMEFCDQWRSLIVLESTGELHICQIGPTKDRGVRCTHRFKVWWNTLDDTRTITVCAPSPSVPPPLAGLASSSSFGQINPHTSELFVPSCMQSVAFHRRHQLVLCDRRGSIVAVEMNRFCPPQRRAQYVFERDSLWATSVRITSSSMENSTTGGTPFPTPRHEQHLGETEQDFDWADDVHVQAVRVTTGGASGIAAAPRLPGLERGPVTSLMHVPSHGSMCLLPAGSRSLYVLSLDGGEYLGELSLDQRPGAPGHLKAPRVPQGDWCHPHDSTTIGSPRTARSTSSSPPRTSRAEANPMIRVVEHMASSSTADDGCSFVDVICQSLLPPPPLSASVSPMHAPLSSRASPQLLERDRNHSLDRRGSLGAPVGHSSNKLAPLVESNVQSSGERHESKFHAFVETVESCRDRIVESVRPSSVLATRSSKRSLLRPSSRAVKPRSNLDEQQPCSSSAIGHGKPAVIQTNTYALRTSSMPVFATRGVIGEFSSDPSHVSTTAEPSLCPKSIRTPYSRRIPSASGASRKPAMHNEEYLTSGHPGISGVTNSIHPLVSEHSRIATELHVGFGSSAQRQLPSAPDLPVGVFQKNAVCSSGFVVSKSPQRQSVHGLITPQRCSMTPPPHSRTYVELPGGRSATPTPQTVGVRSLYLTSGGWKQNAVEVSAASMTKHTLPSLPSKVNARCNITPNKKKETDCSQQQSKAIFSEAITISRSAHGLVD